MNPNNMLFLFQYLQWNPILLMRFPWGQQIKSDNQVNNPHFLPQENFLTDQKTQLKHIKPNFSEQKVDSQQKVRARSNLKQNRDQICSQNDFNPRKQKSQRNLRSNALKYFIKYLESYESKTDKVQRLICFYQMKQYTAENFFSTLKQKFKDSKNYIRPKKIKQLLRDQDLNFAKIFRIFFRNFAKSCRMLYLVHCKKLQTKAKINNARSIKKLFKQFIG